MTNQERNLIARINRRLAHRGWQLHKTRDRWTSELGRYHVIDFYRNHHAGDRWLDSIADLEAYFLELSFADQAA